VTVGEEHSFNFVLPALKANDIRDQVVDAEHFVIGELEPKVDNENIAVYFYTEAVAADLFKSAKRIQLEPSTLQCLLLRLLRLLRRPWAALLVRALSALPVVLPLLGVVRCATILSWLTLRGLWQLLHGCRLLIRGICRIHRRVASALLDPVSDVFHPIVLESE
jgi:hypothetical protein